MRLATDPDSTCAIAHALSVVGDQWSLLVVRDQEHPPRFACHLSPAGHGLLPVLIALQDWGGRFVLGDGSLTATGSPTSAEARRVEALIGHLVPRLTLRDALTIATDPCSGAPWTVLYCFLGAFPPGTLGNPPGWAEIPGATGCTVEATSYRDRLADFSAADAAVRGVSTQRPDQLQAFSKHVGLNFPLRSDDAGELAIALRLPTFRAGGLDRLKRLTLVIDHDRVIRGALYPVTDPAASIIPLTSQPSCHSTANSVPVAIACHVLARRFVYRVWARNES